MLSYTCAILYSIQFIFKKILYLRRLYILYYILDIRSLFNLKNVYMYVCTYMCECMYIYNLIHFPTCQKEEINKKKIDI